MKRRSLKSRKIDLFPKGLTHGFGPKMAIFPNVFFFTNINQENVFNDILEQKKPFQPIKTRSSKIRKIDIFQKDLNHGFGPKIAIYAKFFF